MKHLLLAATLMMASTAHAQNRMSTQECVASWSAIEQMIGTPETDVEFVADDEGWCVIEDARFPISQYQMIRLESLKWRAADIERFIDEGLPPRSFEIVGEGFGMSATTGDPVYDYLFALQSTLPEAGFGLSVRWDGVQNAVEIDEAYFDFFMDNRVELSARVEGVDLTDMETIQTSVGTMGLRDLLVTSEFSGWFETHVALSLGPVLLDSDGPPPQAQVEALRDQAIDIISQIPDTIVPVNSREALSEFIQALPQPRGTARLQLSADPPLGAARMLPFALLPTDPTIDQIIELGLDGVALLFLWTPTGDAQ